MKLLGIPLRKPSFDEVTAATVMGIGLWLVAIGIARAAGVQLDIVDAGAALVIAVWGSVGARLGIRVGGGSRHLVANVAVSALLLLVYQGAWALAV